tara:strand:+ start:1123 stop:1557 length:435 start_codon:yes stop_codon:yes gene_type:complete
MPKDITIIETLLKKGFTKIDVDTIINYLETLDYELEHTKYIGRILSNNERLAKYFFLRDKLNLEIDSSDDSFHINEILDQCIDWSEFWRLLVIKKGFCCICLAGELGTSKRYVFLAGPNILLGSISETSSSIHDEDDEYFKVED